MRIVKIYKKNRETCIISLIALLPCCSSFNLGGFEYSMKIVEIYGVSEESANEHNSTEEVLLLNQFQMS